MFCNYGGDFRLGELGFVRKRADGAGFIVRNVHRLLHADRHTPRARCSLSLTSTTTRTLALTQTAACTQGCVFV